MNKEVITGLLIPFLGTTAGAGCVLFMKNKLSSTVERALSGFAAGVMVAASIWSLIVPAMEQCEDMGRLAFLPAFIGFWIGVLFYWCSITSFRTCTSIPMKRKVLLPNWPGRR